MKKKITRERTVELTPREKEIAVMASEGAGSKQIADGLGIELSTVSKHRRNILAKTRALNFLHFVKHFGHLYSE